MDNQLFQELLCYPQQRWGTKASHRWQRLTDSLARYQPPSRGFTLDKSRKWELVSAFQKSIRRADKAIALPLVSAMNHMPGEHGYFWRRLCVTVCEDVGLADDTLAKFVVACATVFAPKRTLDENYRLWCFLTEQMCDLPVRSHVYCSCETVSLATENCMMPSLSTDDVVIVEAISRQTEAVRRAIIPIHTWQKQSNWRTEGLLKFVGLSLPLESQVKTDPVPAFSMNFDLPSYCFDVHTRIGLEVLRRMVQGVRGAEAIRGFFKQNKTITPHKALGEALFTIEGGREKSELVYPTLSSLEQRVLAHRFGLPFDQWLRLCNLTLEALENGAIDRLREEILRRQYGQENLPLVCQ